MTRVITPGQRFYGSAVGISLRLAVLEDCTPRYLAWLEDPEVNRYLETRWSVQSLEAIRALRHRPARRRRLLPLRHRGRERTRRQPQDRADQPASRLRRSQLFHRRASWGRGIATAAIRIASDIAFGVLGLNRLQAGVYASNLGSVRVLEKAGFRREGVWRRQLVGLGGREDHLWFGLLAEEHGG
jgi:hypothetical protein